MLLSSTALAEYMVLTMATKKPICLRDLRSDLTFLSRDAHTPIYIESE